MTDKYSTEIIALSIALVPFSMMSILACATACFTRVQYNRLRREVDANTMLIERLSVSTTSATANGFGVQVYQQPRQYYPPPPPPYPTAPAQGPVL
jgi:hypothetical protein